MESRAAHRIAHLRFRTLRGRAWHDDCVIVRGCFGKWIFRQFFPLPTFDSHALDFEQKELQMLHYALVFFVVALIAAVFGFGGIAAGAAEIAKILFFIFLVLFVVSLVAGLFRRGR
jgi:uncharacterized membrane protein YtjA (UPF0391 family)